MRFPESESAVAALALKVATGLGRASEDFPDPPVPAERLHDIRERYFDVLGRIQAATAVLRKLHLEKDRVFAEMRDATKADLWYGEIAARHRPDKLSILGWGPPRERVRLAVPGEVRDIAVGEQGETSLELSWQAPADGGKVAMYEMQRRPASGGKWQTIATEGGLAVRLEDQPRGTQLEYRVRGMNRAGVGRPSGVVSVVL